MSWNDIWELPNLTLSLKILVCLFVQSPVVLEVFLSPNFATEKVAEKESGGNHTFGRICQSAMLRECQTLNPIFLEWKSCCFVLFQIYIYIWKSYWDLETYTWVTQAGPRTVCRYTNTTNLHHSFRDWILDSRVSQIPAGGSSFKSLPYLSFFCWNKKTELSGFSNLCKSIFNTGQLYSSVQVSGWGVSICVLLCFNFPVVQKESTTNYPYLENKMLRSFTFFILKSNRVLH